MSKKVMTVLGPVDPETLGPTLTHEHIFIDASCNFVYQEEASLQDLLHAPVSMSMLGLLRRRPFSVCLDNTRLSDESLAIEELTRFQRAGGQTLVDCTVIGIRRDPVAVQRVARATGLNVVQGTGIYVEPSHPDWVATIKVEELAQMFINDVRVGIAETGVRAGLIGEIGTSGVARSSSDYKRVGDITPDEEKVLRAAGRASVETGAAVSVHLDVRGQGAFRIIDILEEEGVAPERMIMSHMDSVADLAYHKAIGARGVFVEYDRGRTVRGARVSRPGTPLCLPGSPSSGRPSPQSASGVATNPTSCYYSSATSMRHSRSRLLPPSFAHVATACDARLAHPRQNDSGRSMRR